MFDTETFSFAKLNVPGGASFLGKTNFAGVTYITPFQLVFRGRMGHNGISAGNRPGAKSLGGNMSDWFEVVERWADVGGVREAIIFVGPLEACESAADEWHSDDLIIRPVSF